jgi:hypothetical protein
LFPFDFLLGVDDRLDFPSALFWFPIDSFLLLGVDERLDASVSFGFFDADLLSPVGVEERLTDLLSLLPPAFIVFRELLVGVTDLFPFEEVGVPGLLLSLPSFPFTGDAARLGGITSYYRILSLFPPFCVAFELDRGISVQKKWKSRDKKTLKKRLDRFQSFIGTLIEQD